MIKALKNYPTLKSLELQDNQLGEGAQSLLADLLNSHPTLTSLYIQDNHLGPVTNKFMQKIYHHQVLLNLDPSQAFYYSEHETIHADPNSRPHDIFYQYEMMESLLKQHFKTIEIGPLFLPYEWAYLNEFKKEDLIKIRKISCRRQLV